MTPEYSTMLRVAERSCWDGLSQQEWGEFTSPALILGYKVLRVGCNSLPDNRVLNEHLLEEFADIADWFQGQ